MKDVESASRGWRTYLRLAFRLALAVYIIVSLYLLFLVGETGLLQKQSPGGSPVGIMVPAAILLLLFGIPTCIAGVLLRRLSTLPIERALALCGIFYFLGVAALFSLGVVLHGLD